VRPGLRALVALCWALSATAGCGPGAATYVDLGQTPRTYRPNDYRSVYQRWTRTILITKDYDTSLDAAATWKSYDFRWAYAVRYSATYQLTAAEQEALLKTQLDELATGNVFYVSAGASRFEWVDFEKANTIWRISLLTDEGHEVRPLEIRKLKKVPAAELEAFYPASPRIQPVSSFYSPYQIRFPDKLPDGTPLIGPHTKRVTLRFAGVLGSAEMSWNIRQAP
jgi:hypothetical protein